jgi:2-iminobutanoate/2-iminopropanoate deaminase
LKAVRAENAPKAIGPYSQAIVHGNLVFTSGQIAIDPKSGNIESDTLEGQTEQVLNNIRSILLATGTDLERVLRCTVYLTNIAEFQAFNNVYARFFGIIPPARTTVEVTRLPKGAKIEIDAIASLD